ncbi:MAG: DUF3105 domain-containing protein [Chloroflexota bacterium]|jgi:hypothetical protein
MGKYRTRKKSTKSSSTSGNQTLLYILIAAVVIGIAGLGYLLYLSLRPEPEIAGIIQYERLSRGHEQNLEIPFGELPPAGGAHDPTWQNCGIYDEPLNTAHVIHSMEHGAAWITYQPNLAPDQIEAIQDKFRGQTYIVVSPYPGQSSPIVMTAWGVQLEVDDLNDRRVNEFIERYRLGPTTPERGAACTNGIGEPIG